MTEIVGDINELEDIDNELKRLCKTMHQLRSRKLTLENSIVEFMAQKGQPGLKYKNKIIIPEERKKRTYRKEKEKRADGESVLKDYGISNTENALREIMEAMRGPSEQRTGLKIKYKK